MKNKFLKKISLSLLPVISISVPIILTSCSSSESTSDSSTSSSNYSSEELASNGGNETEMDSNQKSISQTRYEEAYARFNLYKTYNSTDNATELETAISLNNASMSNLFSRFHSLSSTITTSSTTTDEEWNSWYVSIAQFYKDYSIEYLFVSRSEWDSKYKSRLVTSSSTTSENAIYGSNLLYNIYFMGNFGGWILHYLLTFLNSGYTYDASISYTFTNPYTGNLYDEYQKYEEMITYINHFQTSSSNQVVTTIVPSA